MRPKMKEKISNLNSIKNHFKWITAGIVLFTPLLVDVESVHALMNGVFPGWVAQVGIMGPLPDCGEAIVPFGRYDQISTVSLIITFALFFAATFIEKKKIKTTLFALILLPFGAWLYVQYFVDYDRIREKLFTYDTVAENALANIAEAQDRYKSEQGSFIKNLNQIHSHTAGAHGLNSCVRITKITATFNHWVAEAKHVSSPNTITWDSDSGSSLKKG
jgi:hypothetical protein